MDKRMFLALMALAASPAAVPGLEAQVKAAQATGDMSKISREDVLKSIYRVSIAPTGASVGNRVLVKLGHNSTEAGQMTETTRALAKKAGSVEVFRQILDGKTPTGMQFTQQETALLRLASTRLHTKLDGHTWEGSSSIAAGGGAGKQRVWDGRTWEGSSM